jgi:hypothetical protein
VATEEFCVFWGLGNTPTSVKTRQRSGMFFACGAPHALLAGFVSKKTLSIRYEYPRIIVFIDSAKILRSYK